MNLLCRVPQDINPDSSTNYAPTGGEYPKVNKPPTPNTEEIVQGLRCPRAQVVQKTPPMLVVPHLPPPKLLHVPTLWLPPLVWSQLSPPRCSHQAPGPMDSGPPVGTIQVKAHLCLARRTNRDNIHELQSPLPIILSLSKSSSTSAGSSPQPSTPKQIGQTLKCCIQIYSLLQLVLT
jgi:hypothetical protein